MHTIEKSLKKRTRTVIGLMAQGGQVYFYHNDHLGTPQKMTDASGAVAWSATYTSFGAAMIDSASTVTNNLRFPGQYFDAETGLHYNFHRYYDPKTGRYITEDMIGQKGGVNLFVYVLNNPTLLIDERGLKVEVCSREAKIPGGHLLHKLGLDHQWLKTDTMEAGMGPLLNLPDTIPPIPYEPVTIRNESVKKEGGSCKEIKCINEDCVNSMLKLGMGRFIGVWTFDWNCNTLVDVIISICRMKYYCCGK